MREGWVGDDYLNFVRGDEQEAKSANYSFPELLPGYKLVGLRGWDYFIVDDDGDHSFTVPTVTASKTHLAPFRLPDVDQPSIADERFRGKIKWYAKPLVFDGDPSSHQNQAWIDRDRDQHANLVRYWNHIYRSIKSKSR